MSGASSETLSERHRFCQLVRQHRSSSSCADLDSYFLLKICSPISILKGSIPSLKLK